MNRLDAIEIKARFLISAGVHSSMPDDILALVAVARAAVLLVADYEAHSRMSGRVVYGSPYVKPLGEALQPLLAEESGK